jgi:hypothetical protein
MKPEAQHPAAQLIMWCWKIMYATSGRAEFHFRGKPNGASNPTTNPADSQ